MLSRFSRLKIRPKVMTPKKVPVAIPDYKVGNMVFHPKFGEGQITEVSNRRDGDLELAVLFKKKEHGQKRLIASLSNLSCSAPSALLPARNNTSPNRAWMFHAFGVQSSTSSRLKIACSNMPRVR